MKLAFIDESGYSPNWIADIATQPFYVLAAICIDATAYPKACSDMRRDIAPLRLPGLQHPIGELLGCGLKVFP
jgi:hypothetical protein